MGIFSSENSARDMDDTQVKKIKPAVSLPTYLGNEDSDEEEQNVPEWATYENLREKLATQNDEFLTKLFKSDLYHPAIDKFMKMAAPLAKRFAERTDSADWTHLTQKKAGGAQKSVSISATGAELTQLSKQWALKDFELGMEFTGRFVTLYLGRTLGKGRFATVYLAREKTTGSVVVLKVIYRSVLAKYQAEKALRNEIEIQAHMRHPNIVRIYGYFFDEDRIYLVLEYAMHGDIFNDVQLCRLDEDTSANYIFQVAKAVGYMHENFVIHRDIKLENVYLNDLGTIKIGLSDFFLGRFLTFLGDFGWACHKHNLKSDSVVGTLHYMAPEMLSEEEYDYKVDVWAMGVLLYEMLVGELPFYGADDAELESQIISGPVKYPGYLSVGAKDILCRMLDRDPNTRISVAEICEHSWVTGHIAVKSLKHLVIEFIRETQVLYQYDLTKLDPKVQQELQKDLVHHRFFSE